MGEQLKHRIIGAVVLLSMAVIFIPMILGGKISTSRLGLPAPMAPKPIFIYEEPPQWGETARANGGERPITRFTPPAAAAPLPPPRPAPVKPTPPKPAVTADPKLPLSPPVPPLTTAKPNPNSATATATATATETKPAESHFGWVIQVASAKRQEGAVSLKDKLVGGGFRAFLLTAQDESGAQIYRVRIGPFNERAEALEQLQKLTQQYSNLKGIVVSHTPP